MKAILVVAAVYTMLLQPLSAQLIPPAQGRHPKLTLDSTIHVPDTSVKDAFSQIVEIGTLNQIPMGIVLGDGQDRPICQDRLKLSAGEEVSVSELIGAIENGAPGYGASLNEGVLEIAPKQLAPGPSRLLDLVLPEFHSGPLPHAEIGWQLWGAIRLYATPAQGVDLGGISSPDAETVPGLRATNESVRSILNRIVKQGHGGVWILYSSQVRELTKDTARPFEIHGYVGKAGPFRMALDCMK